MRRRVLALLLLGCDAPAPAPAPVAPAPTLPAPWTDAWLDTFAPAFLHDLPARRDALLTSLTNHANTYSVQRLGSYALGTSGWDTLPVWNPRSIAVTTTTPLDALPDGTPPLWDGATPTTHAAWVALGREVFFRYPLRAEVFLEYALARPKVMAATGIETTASGDVPGAVLFVDVDGETRVGLTCALCHTAVREGVTVVGAARRRFDYGALRLAYHAELHVPVDAELARRMKTWGPGRADVTEDVDEDPVAIPDLWGLRAQRTLTQAATIRHESPLALAIRQETQLLHSNHQRIRPPRELAWALAMYVYSLEPPPARAPSPADATLATRGASLFARHCAGCHANEVHGGRPVEAARVGTDPALANGHARGTGTYRVPALVRVADAAPYLHHGVVASLEELLSPARVAKIPGHTFGTELAAPERAALITFLRTL